MAEISTFAATPTPLLFRKAAASSHQAISASRLKEFGSAVSSAHSKRAYEKVLKDFLAWYSAEARPPVSRAIVQQYRSVLESAALASASINLRMSAIRKLAAEAAENSLLDRSAAQGAAFDAASIKPYTAPVGAGGREGPVGAGPGRLGSRAAALEHSISRPRARDSNDSSPGFI